VLRLTKSNLFKALYRSILCEATLAALVVCAAAQTEVQGLRGMAIAPVMYRATGHAGAALALPVEIQNLDMTPVKVTLTIHSVTYSDWTYGPNLDKANKFDCSDWFPTKTYEKTIASTSNFTIPLKCTVPKGTLNGVYYCLGTIEPTVDPSNPNKIHAQYQIPIIVRIGSLPKPELKFGSPTLDVQSNLTTITMPFVNDGDVFTVIGATAQVRDATGRLVATRTDADRNLYPQSKRKLSFSLPQKLPDGQYQVQVTCQVNLQTFRPITAAYVVTKGKAVPATPGAVISLPPFTVDPPVFHGSMPTGATRMQTIKFTNQTANQLTVAVTVHRLSQSNNGLFQVLEDKAIEPLQVELSPETLVIPPRGTAVLRVKASVASGATGDTWFAISAVSTAHDSLSQEIYGSIRVPKTENPKLEITPGEVGKVGSIPISTDYEVTNNGNIALLPKVNASIMEAGLTAIAKLEVPPLGDGGILPGATLHNRLMLPPNLKPGAYTVRLEYQYAEKDGQPISEIKQLPFFVPAAKKTTTPPKKTKTGGLK